MSNRLQDCLTGKDPNYLYPFLMYREPGEDLSEEDIVKEIEAIASSGCGGFLIETRRHSDWGGDGWWKDLGFVLQEGKKRDLKVWLTDDVSVPSGKANWAVRRYPQLRRKALAQNTVDIIGPQVGAAVLAELFQREGETLYAAIAYRVSGTDAAPVYTDPIDLTAHVQDGLLLWDVPEGFWRVFLIFRTQTRGVAEFWDYVDLLNPASCRLMIDEVYEPHYRHFGEYFGTTLEGFFTDEPVFGNMADHKMNYREKLGADSVLLPWREDIPAIIAAEEGWSEEETRLALPCFWRDMGGKTPTIRRRYMDILTRNYSENFVKPIGKWCADHGVLYTGHVLEDMNAHFRFGWSTGHFFRSQEGQHTAGIDLVLQQLKVGGRDISHATVSSAKYSDPAFYLYFLGRLGASCGHLYPHMQGRVMCENAGAGGWGEGLSIRKYMLDAMMAAGGNLVCSAVFDPKWNNNHIPPFVYDHGEHPQYPFLKPLMLYVNRLCHLLSGGIHRANALVYYPAEGDWAGDITPPQQTVAPLAQAHVDFDIAPWDLLKGDTLTIRDGKLQIHRECFDALVVPFCDYLPGEILNRFAQIARQVPVIFGDKLPRVSETGQVFADENILCLPKETIPQWFLEKGFVDFRLEGCPDLMHLHMRHEGTETYFFFNLSAAQPIDATAQFPYRGDYILYDAWDNAAVSRSTEDGSLRLRIPPKGTLVLIFGGKAASGNLLPAGELDDLRWQPIPGDTALELSMRGSTEQQWTSPVAITADQLRNLVPEYPRFSGSLLYTAKLTSEQPAAYIDLGNLGETAAVTVNGKPCGMQVASPYRFRVAEAWTAGENTVQILIASNYAYAKRDPMSGLLTLPPTGLIGPISLGFADGSD